MSIGQIAEILTMLVLGATLKRLGWRTTMIVGILGHAARFAVFAFLPQYPGARHRSSTSCTASATRSSSPPSTSSWTSSSRRTPARARRDCSTCRSSGFGPLVANTIGPVLISETFNHGWDRRFPRPVPRSADLGDCRGRRARAALPSARQDQDTGRCARHLTLSGSTGFYKVLRGSARFGRFLKVPQGSASRSL